MNESTDNDGFTPVLGRGHRAKNPERMRALALSTADSDDEAVPACPRRQPSQCTKVKSSSLNTANSFESLRLLLLKHIGNSAIIIRSLTSLHSISGHLVGVFIYFAFPFINYPCSIGSTNLLFQSFG